MPKSLLQNMRERAGRLRRIADIAHDPAMIEMLRGMANEIEAEASAIERKAGEQGSRRLQ